MDFDPCPFRAHQIVCRRDSGNATLADRLGVTFQQIQKYKKGNNRVSSSRLAMIAETLGVPPAYFFPGSTVDLGQAATAAAPELVSFIETNEGRDLNVAFARISSKTMRRKVVGLVTALAAALPPQERDFSEKGLGRKISTMPP